MRLNQDATGYTVYDAALGKNIRLGRGKDRAAAAEEYAEFIRQKTLYPRRPYRRSDSLLLSELFAKYMQSPDFPTARYQVNRWKRCYALLMGFLKEHRKQVTPEADAITAVDLTLFQEKLAGPLSLRAQTIRHLIGVVRQLYKWGFARGHVGEQAYREVIGCGWIKAAKGTSAPRSPVTRQHADVVVELLPEPFRTIVVVMRETGMRPGEVLAMRPCDLLTGGVHIFGGLPFDLDRTGVWLYVLASHKTEHHGINRVVGLNKVCQDALQPFLAGRPKDLPLFSPKERVAKIRREQRACRVGGGNKKRPAKHPNRAPGLRYHPSTLTRAIRQACESAGIPVWTAYQLRYLGAATLQREHGADTARAMLGHVSGNMTRHYSGPDVAKIIAAAGQLADSAS